MSFSSKPIEIIDSRTFAIRRPDVDTDQILPARFLTATSSEGFADMAFADWRFASDGSPLQGSPLAEVDFRNRQILVAGRNFGCGSSREHAAWALRDLGVRAILSTRLADIFCNNALKNGILAVEIDDASYTRLVDQAGERIVIDLDVQTISLPDGSVTTFEIDTFRRHCLLNGIDEMGYLQSIEADITAFENRRAEARDAASGT